MPTTTPTRNGKLTLEDLGKKIERKLTRKPLTLKEIAERVALEGYDARGLGRPMSVLVRQGRAVKHAARVPTYTKPTED